MLKYVDVDLLLMLFALWLCSHSTSDKGHEDLRNFIVHHITVYIYGYVPQKAMNVFFCVVIMLLKLENGFTTPFIHKTEFPAVSQGVTVKTDHDY